MTISTATALDDQQRKQNQSDYSDRLTQVSHMSESLLVDAAG